MNNTLKKYKEYREGYNNPEQYNVKNIVSVCENTTDEKLISKSIRIIIGVNHANRDKENNQYKFIAQ
jgi:hypothetical protein